MGVGSISCYNGVLCALPHIVIVYAYSMVSAMQCYTQARVAMIHNVHYSGIYGLMKLILTEALPDSLTQVRSVDSLVSRVTLIILCLCH